MAVFPFSCGHNFPTEMTSQQLHTITDAEHRDTQIEDSFLDGRCPFVINSTYTLLSPYLCFKMTFECAMNMRNSDSAEAGTIAVK